MSAVNLALHFCALHKSFALADANATANGSAAAEAQVNCVKLLDLWVGPTWHEA